MHKVIISSHLFFYDVHPGTPTETYHFTWQQMFKSFVFSTNTKYVFTLYAIKCKPLCFNNLPVIYTDTPILLTKCLRLTLTNTYSTDHNNSLRCSLYLSSAVKCHALEVFIALCWQSWLCVRKTWADSWIYGDRG